MRRGKKRDNRRIEAKKLDGEKETKIKEIMVGAVEKSVGEEIADRKSCMDEMDKIKAIVKQGKKVETKKESEMMRADGSKLIVAEWAKVSRAKIIAKMEDRLDGYPFASAR